MHHEPYECVMMEMTEFIALRRKALKGDLQAACLALSHFDEEILDRIPVAATILGRRVTGCCVSHAYGFEVQKVRWDESEHVSCTGAGKVNEVVLLGKIKDGLD